MEGFERHAGIAIALALAWAALPAIGCGDEDGPEEVAEREVAAELERLRADFDAGRVAGVCARMSAGPRCRPLLRFLHDRAAPDTSEIRTGEREVLRVALARGGTRATATVTLSERVHGRLRFVRREDGWRLGDVGIRADVERPLWRAEPTVLLAEQPPALPLRCPPILRIVHRGPEPVRGGCVMRVAGDATVVMLTAFGDYAVARCRLRFHLHAASNSTGTLADHIELSGPGACARARRCVDGETGLRYPWQGDRFVGSLGAGIHARFDICVNTPLGRARGMLHYRLARRDGDLVAKPYDYPIGESSLQLTGRWDVEPDRFGPPARRR